MLADHEEHSALFFLSINSLMLHLKFSEMLLLSLIHIYFFLSSFTSFAPCRKRRVVFVLYSIDWCCVCFDTQETVLKWYVALVLDSKTPSANHIQSAFVPVLSHLTHDEAGLVDLPLYSFASYAHRCLRRSPRISRSMVNRC